MAMVIYSNLTFIVSLRLSPKEALHTCNTKIDITTCFADSKHPQTDKGYFQRREFCFTLDGDIFVRYQSFKDSQEMRNAIRDRCPSKIDIGPVYSVDPQRRAAYAAGQGFVPVERELVFDIDLTDYDDVRTCGSEGHICNKCWPLMAAAITILDRGLREDFGFEHVLFVYSGRRGVHAWVCDERARALTDEQRGAIANYFAVYKGQEKGVAKLSTSVEDHPAIAKAYKILLPAFIDTILPEQRFLEDPTHMNTILSYIPSEAVKAEVRRKWQTAPGEPGELSVERWKRLEACVHEERDALLKANPRDLRMARALDKALKDIIFAYAYPRLDMEVSKKMNHLLKAPFCVHPKTGKVCVPIDPEKAWQFDPEGVCTVGSLLNQLNTSAPSTKGGDGDGGSEEWKKTDMADAVNVFRSCFLDALYSESKASLTAKSREASSAPTLAW